VRPFLVLPAIGFWRLDILDAHYLGRDVKLAEIAVMKLETRTKL
jgi:hypothetical protein